MLPLRDTILNTKQNKNAIMISPYDDRAEPQRKILGSERIRGELASGKFLILPPSIYQHAVKLCRDAGWSESELENLYESKPLPTVSQRLSHN